MTVSDLGAVLLKVLKDVEDGIAALRETFICLPMKRFVPGEILGYSLQVPVEGSHIVVILHHPKFIELLLTKSTVASG